jgi:CBS domain-containing protein
MTPDPVSVHDDLPALEAFDLMVEHGIRHLPVVVGSPKRVIGILSIDDLRAAFPFDVSLKRPIGMTERMQARDFRMTDVMTWAPQTVQPGTSLQLAARILADHRIGCLPVVDDENLLVGILSETDVLRALDASMRPVATAEERRSDGLVDALRAERERIAEQLAKWQQSEASLLARVRDEPRDAGDRAADEHAVSTLERLSERAASRLDAIDGALERAKRGRFGICELCQGRIPATRLRAIPETSLCVRCARATADAGERRIEARAN